MYFIFPLPQTIILHALTYRECTFVGLDRGSFSHLVISYPYKKCNFSTEKSTIIHLIIRSEVLYIIGFLKMLKYIITKMLPRLRESMVHDQSFLASLQVTLFHE